MVVLINLTSGYACDIIAIIWIIEGVMYLKFKEVNTGVYVGEGRKRAPATIGEYRRKTRHTWRTEPYIYDYVYRVSMWRGSSISSVIDDAVLEYKRRHGEGEINVGG